MMPSARLAAALALALASGGPAAAAADLQLGGQVRSRWELRDNGATSDYHTATRTRLDARARLDGGVSAFVQWQDVRLWGEESSTLGDFSGDQIDLHQGYAQFDGFAGQPVDVRLGRQEISLGGQRLVGAVGWTHQARSFDAARLTWRSGGSTVDVIGARLGDTTSPAAVTDASFFGAYATLASLDGTELFVLLNSADPGTDQVTAGARRVGRASGLSYRVEGAYQTGERAGADVAAFLVAARVGRDVGDVSAQLWFDYLSGDEDPFDGETKVFDTLFATNHKFYGYADTFLNIPLHTGGGGLQDLALKLSTSPRPGWSVGLDLHSFRLAEDAVASDGRLGEEADLTVGVDYRGVARFTGGLSYVIAGDGLIDVGRLADDALFAYLMADVRF